MNVATKGRQRRRNGFTLIELMITVAVVAILTAIAYPAYTQFIIRSKRSAAQAQMMDIATRQQQYLMANRGYADKAALTSSGYALPAEVAANYTYDVVADNSAMPKYTITFTPSGSQASDGDLTLTSEGVKLPAKKW